MRRKTGLIIALLAAMAVFALFGCSGGDTATQTTTTEAAPAEPSPARLTAVEEAEQHGLEITAATGHQEDQAPEFTGLTKWLNSPPLTLEELEGEVVMVDFWTYT